MTAYITAPAIGHIRDASALANDGAYQTTQLAPSMVEHADFQAMVDGDESGESAFAVNGVSNANGVLDLVRGVESSRGEVQSALMTAAASTSPEDIFRASKAMSKYDLQTLFLSKVANKTFQAVDRLTNLQ